MQPLVRRVHFRHGRLGRDGDDGDDDNTDTRANAHTRDHEASAHAPVETAAHATTRSSIDGEEHGVDVDDDGNVASRRSRFGAYPAVPYYGLLPDLQVCVELQHGRDDKADGDGSDADDGDGSVECVVRRGGASERCSFAARVAFVDRCLRDVVTQHGKTYMLGSGDVRDNSVTSPCQDQTTSCAAYTESLHDVYRQFATLRCRGANDDDDDDDDDEKKSERREDDDVAAHGLPSRHAQGQHGQPPPPQPPQQQQQAPVCHHVVYVRLRGHAVWRDVNMLLALEQRRLVLFLAASSRVTQEYLRARVAAVSGGDVVLEWVAGAALVSEPRTLQLGHVHAVGVVFDAFVNMPLHVASLDEATALHARRRATLLLHDARSRDAAHGTRSAAHVPWHRCSHQGNDRNAQHTRRVGDDTQDNRHDHPDGNNSHNNHNDTQRNDDGRVRYAEVRGEQTCALCVAQASNASATVAATQHRHPDADVPLSASAPADASSRASLALWRRWYTVWSGAAVETVNATAVLIISSVPLLHGRTVSPVLRLVNDVQLQRLSCDCACNGDAAHSAATTTAALLQAAHGQRRPCNNSACAGRRCLWRLYSHMNVVHAQLLAQLTRCLIEQCHVHTFDMHFVIDKASDGASALSNAQAHLHAGTSQRVQPPPPQQHRSSSSPQLLPPQTQQLWSHETQNCDTSIANTSTPTDELRRADAGAINADMHDNLTVNKTHNDCVAQAAARKRTRAEGWDVDACAQQQQTQTTKGYTAAQSGMTCIQDNTLPCALLPRGPSTLSWRGYSRLSSQAWLLVQNKQQHGAVGTSKAGKRDTAIHNNNKELTDEHTTNDTSDGDDEYEFELHAIHYHNTTSRRHNSATHSHDTKIKTQTTQDQQHHTNCTRYKHAKKKHSGPFVQPAKWGNHFHFDTTISYCISSHEYENNDKA